MSPRLQQITEQRAHAAYWMMAGWLVIVVHGLFLTIAFAKTRSLWGPLIAAITLFCARMSWKNFKRANRHFEALDRANTSH